MSGFMEYIDVKLTGQLAFNELKKNNYFCLFISRYELSLAIYLFFWR
ncbi:MAG: hypothetical protein K0R59_2330 [Sphingobacterium sp.]|jgi:hypothetical protein|nr:hypothetical protein [Sphingobacterium sp.]